MMNRIGLLEERLYRNEERVLLTPDHVTKVVRDHDVEVVVEPSAKRCSADDLLTRRYEYLFDFLSKAS